MPVLPIRYVHRPRVQQTVKFSVQTVSAMISFLMLMALNPGVQKRAQQEIDEVVGKAHLPRCSDLGRLGYLLAVFKEVVRYAPIANLGSFDSDHIATSLSLLAPCQLFHTD